MSFLKELNKPGYFYTNVVLLFILLNLALAGSNWGLDLSRDQKNSVSKSAEKVLSRLDSPLLVEAYISRDLPGQLMAYMDPYLATLRSLKSVGGDKIDLRIIDPVLPEEVSRARERGIQGIALTEAREIEVTSRQFYFGIYMQYGEESRVIQLVDGQGRVTPNLEYEFLKKLRAMLRKDEPSGIALITTDGALTTEQPQRASGYKKDSIWGFRTLLEEDTGRIEETDLQKPVKSTIRTLLLGGLPSLDETQLYYLDQFLMRGGNLIFLAQGSEFQIQQRRSNPYLEQLGMGGGGSMGFASVPKEKLKNINEWLGKYGLHIEGGLLIDPGKGVIQINDPLRRTPIPQPYPAWAYYSRDEGNIIGQHKLIANTNELIFPWGSSLDIRQAAQSGGKVEYKVLLQSNADAISQENQALDFKPILEMLRDPTVDRIGTPRPLMVLATGRFRSAFTKDSLPAGIEPETFKPGQIGDSRSNILLIGSAYLVSDIFLTGRVNYELFGLNRSFLQNALEALQGDDELLEVRAKVPALAILNIKDPLFRLLFMVLHIFTIPVLLAVYGTLRLMRRNRKQGVVDDSKDSSDEGLPSDAQDSQNEEGGSQA